MIEVKVTYYPPESSGESKISYDSLITISELRSFKKRDEELVALKARHAFSVVYNNSPTLQEELSDANT